MGALRVGSEAQMMPTQDSVCVQMKARLVEKVMSCVTVLAAMSRETTRMTEVTQTLGLSAMLPTHVLEFGEGERGER